MPTNACVLCRVLFAGIFGGYCLRRHTPQPIYEYVYVCMYIYIY